MSGSELAVISPDSFATPTIITRAAPKTRKKFFEFFTVPIRNANTRAAYYRAIQQFLAWAERAGYQHLEDIEPITVAAYIASLAAGRVNDLLSKVAGGLLYSFVVLTLVVGTYSPALLWLAAVALTVSSVETLILVVRKRRQDMTSIHTTGKAR